MKQITFYSEDKETCMFPELEIGGIWRLQTTNQNVITNIKKRIRESAKWKLSAVGCNPISCTIFTKNFSNTQHAKNVFKNLLKTEGIPYDQKSLK